MTVIQKLVDVYKVWHELLPNFSRPARYTICERIDGLFIEIIELIFTAVFAPTKERLSKIETANKKLDLIKFLFQVMWQIKLINDRRYIHVSKPLEELGKILGGWRKQLIKETSSAETEEE